MPCSSSFASSLALETISLRVCCRVRVALSQPKGAQIRPHRDLQPEPVRRSPGVLQTEPVRRSPVWGEDFEAFLCVFARMSEKYRVRGVSFGESAADLEGRLLECDA